MHTPFAGLHSPWPLQVVAGAQDTAHVGPYSPAAQPVPAVVGTDAPFPFVAAEKYRVARVESAAPSTAPAVLPAGKALTLREMTVGVAPLGATLEL